MPKVAGSWRLHPGIVPQGTVHLTVPRRINRPRAGVGWYEFWAHPAELLASGRPAPYASAPEQ